MRSRDLLASAAVLLAACSGPAPPGHGPPASRAAVVAAPASGLADGPFDLTVSGLRAGELVRVDARATDATGEVWRSEATFRADRRGQLDVSRSASLAGTYTGTDATGLLWSMRPANGTDPRLTFFVPPDPGWTVSLTVRAAGQVAGVTTVRRLMTGPGVSAHPVSRAAVGFTGEYFAPGGAPARRPAVLVIGGSDPGMQVPADAAALLASHGVPALALCYFGCPGVPANLDQIPLEYFTRALRWLAGRPGVNPDDLWVAGISRGSEAALLLGADFPRLVHGVVAEVPSDVVNEALIGYRPVDQSAWTLRGHPLPFTRQFGNPQPTDVPTAVIPVQRIAGPVLLVAAADDQLWPSPAYSRAIMDSLARARRPFPRRLVTLRDAGHDISELVPNLPAGTSTFFQGHIYSLGGTRASNQAAKVVAWEALLQLLTARAAEAEINTKLY
jgi:dienelactone hydrolase